jgi:hypothetical protein
MTDIVKLAAGLTETQLSKIRNEAYYGRNGWKLPKIDKALSRAGVLIVGSSFMTEAGIAIYGHLLDQEKI